MLSGNDKYVELQDSKEIFDKIGLEGFEEIKDKYREFVKRVTDGLENDAKKSNNMINLNGTRKNVELNFIEKLNFGISVTETSDKYRGKININLGTIFIIFNFYEKNEFLKNKNKDILKDISIYFLLLHEISHIYFKHFRHLKKYKEKVETEKQQILEAHADIFSINKIIELIKAQFKNNRNLIDKVGGRKELWQIVILSLHAIFYLGRKEEEYNNIEENSHPLMLIREGIVVQHIIDIAEEIEKKEVDKIIIEAEKKLDSIFNINESEKINYINKYNMCYDFGNKILKILSDEVEVDIKAVLNKEYD